MIFILRLNKEVTYYLGEYWMESLNIMMLVDFFVTIFSKGRVPKHCKSVVFDHRGGGLAETTPLFVKYIHKGNTYYLVEL